MPEENEQKIIMGLRQGNEQAQHTFFNQYYEDILHYLFYGGKSRCYADVQEIINDTFLRAFRDINKFRGQSGIRTWLFSLADHAAIDFYRSSKNIYSGLSLEEHTQTTPVNPLADALKKEEQEKIQELLQKLSEEHRKVITLRLIDGYTVRQTADIMEKTEGAIKVLFLRAARKLKEIVRENPYFKDYKGSNGGDVK